MNCLIFVNLNQTITTKKPSENENKTRKINQFKHSSRGNATQTKNTQLLLASLVFCLKSSLKLVWASCTVAHLVQYSEASQKLTDQLTHQYSLSLCTNILQICFVSHPEFVSF